MDENDHAMQLLNRALQLAFDNGRAAHALDVAQMNYQRAHQASLEANMAVAAAFSPPTDKKEVN